MYALFSREKAPCQKCSREINARALVCRHYKAFAGDVWKCPICRQPSLMAIDAECRTFTCPGLRGEKFTVANEI